MKTLFYTRETLVHLPVTVTMKLSFSLPPKPKSRVRLNSDRNADVGKGNLRNDGFGDGNLKQFVAEFDPSQTLTDAKPKYVIPPLENRWRPYKEMKNIDLPLQAASDLEFEVEIPSGDGDKITYGLILRQNVEPSKPENVEQIILNNMRRDLVSLPDAPELDDFDDVPVEGYGVALLAGYGWKPGQGIGRRVKEDVQIFQFKKWSCNKEGIGFNLDNPRVKDTKAKGKEICKSDKPRRIKGRDVILGSGSKQEVKLGINENENVDKYRVVSKRSRETECKQKNYRGETRETREKASWLRSHIKVRIISKDVKGGRLYLKKAVVTDVVGPLTCDVIMDETQELVQGIHQELLETALPRRGGWVLVLTGRHKGVYGALVDIDLDKETGVVCVADTQKRVDVKLEQVAEYIGDPDDIGY